MRLWSIHPRHLDAKGLVALWREGLLARCVLAGLTDGYRHHPQLERFRNQRNPLQSIDAYLSRVLDEAVRRGYAFDRRKIRYRDCGAQIQVSRGQLEYEWRHFGAKLRLRDRSAWRSLRQASPEPHPIFIVVAGAVEVWEVGRKHL